MDFGHHYTEEQERFRQEVRTWIKENVPENMKSPVDQDDRSRGWFTFWREKQKELGVKGWLYPTYPKEYGGGGLTGEHETILEEEFTNGKIPGTMSNGALTAALMVWATEEQKQKFLKPMLLGNLRVWMKYTEPQAGTDLANVQGTAVRDGDDWVLNGNNQFITGFERPDMLFGPAKTDPDAPRHRNLGFFLIPFPHPGVEIIDQRLANNMAQHFVHLRDARLPADHLIGDDHQGWQVVNTVLEQEHGSRGQAFPNDQVVESLVRWMQEHKKGGHELGDDLVVQDATVAAHIDSHCLELMEKRTYFMHMSGQEMTWEGSNTALVSRDVAIRNVARARDIMGMYALMGSHDLRAVDGGLQEMNLRACFSRIHGAGSRNIAKVIVARRIGISRTKERAAITARV